MTWQKVDRMIEDLEASPEVKDTLRQRLRDLTRGREGDEVTEEDLHHLYQGYPDLELSSTRIC